MSKSGETGASTLGVLFCVVLGVAVVGGAADYASSVYLRGQHYTELKQEHYDLDNDALGVVTISVPMLPVPAFMSDEASLTLSACPANEYKILDDPTGGLSLELDGNRVSADTFVATCIHVVANQ